MRAVSERERARVSLLVAALSVLMGAGGGVVASQGGAVLEVLGFTLIVFGLTGLVQAGAIGLGYLTPGSTGDGEDPDARRD